MQRLFSTEGRIYGGMERIYQVMLLNCLFIISCLPVVTIGAAITAAYGTAYKLVDYREGILYKEYLHQFKLNFWPATKIWLLLIGLILGGFAIFPFMRPFLVGNRLAYYVMMIVMTALALTVLYLFPLTARFDNTLSGTVVNAMILSLKHLPISILLFFVSIGGVLVPFYFPKLLFAWLFVGVGLVFFLNAKLILKVFAQYENTEERS